MGDRVVALDQGRIVADGLPLDMVAAPAAPGSGPTGGVREPLRRHRSRSAASTTAPWCAASPAPRSSWWHRRRLPSVPRCAWACGRPRSSSRRRRRPCSASATCSGDGCTRLERDGAVVEARVDCGADIRVRMAADAADAVGLQPDARRLADDRHPVVSSSFDRSTSTGCVGCSSSSATGTRFVLPWPRRSATPSWRSDWTCPSESLERLGLIKAMSAGLTARPGASLAGRRRARPARAGGAGLRPCRPQPDPPHGGEGGGDLLHDRGAAEPADRHLPRGGVEVVPAHSGCRRRRPPWNVRSTGSSIAPGSSRTTFATGSTGLGSPARHERGATSPGSDAGRRSAHAGGVGSPRHRSGRGRGRGRPRLRLQGRPAGTAVVFVEQPADVEAVLCGPGAFRPPVGPVRLRRDHRGVHGGDRRGRSLGLVGARGHDPRTALHYRDKALQKAPGAGRRGYRLPAPSSLTTFAGPEPCPDVGFDAAVLKPLAGCGTQFVRRVATVDLAQELAGLVRSRDCPRTLPGRGVRHRRRMARRRDRLRGCGQVREPHPLRRAVPAPR